MRTTSLISLFSLAALVLIVPVRAAAQAADSPAGDPKVIDGFVRREPVLPVNLPDYELTTLDVKKEVVFHIGNRTVIGRIPILVYVPVTRGGRAAAVDHLIQARATLVKAAAGTAVTTSDLAAIQDLIEQALGDLRADAPAIAAPTPTAAGK